MSGIGSMLAVGNKDVTRAARGEARQLSIRGLLLALTTGIGGISEYTRDGNG